MSQYLCVCVGIFFVCLVVWHNRWKAERRYPGSKDQTGGINDCEKKP